MYFCYTSQSSLAVRFGQSDMNSFQPFHHHCGQPSFLRSGSDGDFSLVFTSHDSLEQYCLDSIHCIDSDPRTATTIVSGSMLGCGVDNSGCAGGSGCTAAEHSCKPHTGSAG